MGTLLRATLLSLVIHFIFFLGFRWRAPQISGEVALGVPINALIASRPESYPSLPAEPRNKSEGQRIAAPLPKRIMAMSTPDKSRISRDFSRLTAATALPVKSEFPHLLASGRRENVGVAPLIQGQEAANFRDVGQYRLSLAREARRFASKQGVSGGVGLTGVVIVAIRMSLGATPPTVALKQSSGSDWLDANALGLMENAVRIAVVPEALRGKQFAIHVPIHYQLDE